ncbi:muconate cycloisomerase [Amycolatopsis sulphurea]|uniref:Muconate cycloisomerase n=1 Tax=Amycolatopsis sulphurea TaxID=76022 RepID=A0A2A9FF45_9PSEU|nr:muconate/chloromuconate family cycloisomerase [Amycolatopsis sulphurea]PFG49192.1 muconate cycloisomerase [Amycolatopsis sulphurea]
MPEATVPAAVLRVAALETRLLDIPLVRPHRFSVATMHTQGVLLIRLVTEDGVVGWGEGVVPGGPWWGGESVEGMAALVEHHLAPLVLGQDVLRPEALARHLEKHAAGAPFARAGVEMAVWDAAGRALNVPVSQLLGGARQERLPVTWALGTEPAEIVIDEARELLAQGRHHSFKLKMGTLPADEDVTRVSAVTHALDGAAPVAVDLNGAWDEHTARRWLPALAEAGVHLAEQPLPAANVAGLARLRHQTTIAIMADESLWTPADALHLATAHAADVLALKIGKSGGLSATRRIAAVADAAGLGCYGGTTIETSLGTSASAHLFAATTVGVGTELFGPLLLADDIATEPVTYEAGELLLTDGLGFGITIDEEKVAKYARR